MQIPLLDELIIIFGLSIVVVFFSHRIRIPAIVGFLLTGIVAGPHGLGLVKSIYEVEILAEIGVMLLLFAIGIEFSLNSLLQIKKVALIGGSLQVLLTLLASFLIAKLIGQPSVVSIFMGSLICLSSTAIVLKLLQERAEVDSPHGRTILGILIFQDVITVPLVLITPLLAGATENLGESVPALVGKGIGIILLVIIVSKWVVPHVLYQIARTRSRELFLLTVVVICLSVTWLTSSAGLSLALGAFLAGLIISESEYSYQALGSIVPFRDVFTSLFFISIGMLLNVGFLFQHPGSVALITLGVLVVKSVIACFTTLLLGFPIRTAILVGLSLAQVGEFSFILSKAGAHHGLLTGDTYQMFLAFSVLSMVATPFIIAMAPAIANFVSRLPLPKRLKSGVYSGAGVKVSAKKKNHLIIIGFGVNGKNVARAARVAGIPYVIIEMNPETVRSEQARGEPIYFGDATQGVIVQHANIKEARVVVAAINDPVATRKITEIVRRYNPKVYLIVRTRYVQEMKPLYDLGADEVIPEEFETSVEIFTRVLVKYLIPRDEIEKFTAEVRADGYGILRSSSKESASLSDLKTHLPDIEITTFRINQGSSLVGKSLAQIDLRKKYGVTLLAIQRGLQTVTNPGGNTRLCENDLLVVIARAQNLGALSALLQHSVTGEEKGGTNGQ